MQLAKAAAADRAKPTLSVLMPLPQGLARRVSGAIIAQNVVICHIHNKITLKLRTNSASRSAVGRSASLRCRA